MPARFRASLRERISYANVMSTVAVFIALGGTSYAAIKLPAGSVNEKQLKSDSVTSKKIRDGAVTAADLAPGAIAAGPRGPRGVTGAQGPQGATGLAAPEGWATIQFLSGWGHYGVGFQLGSFSRDQLGVVRLRGLVSRLNGPPTLGSLITVLPPGYRPKMTRIYAVHTGEGPTQVGRVDVGSDGQVVWNGGATGETDYTSLEGIEFDTN